MESFQAISVIFKLVLGSTIMYYFSIVLVVVILPCLIFAFLHFPDIFGYSLSDWIGKTRRKNSEDAARKLQLTKKILGALAHDVLKHRLLGLVSLLNSIEQREARGETLKRDEYDDFLEEIFRLCGTKATPHDRLWMRWVDTFKEIKKISDDAIQTPFFDPLLRDTHRVMTKLRALFSKFVAKEQANAISPESLKKLHVEKVAPLHQAILKLSDGCQMVIEPSSIVQDAIRVLSLQMGRKKSLDKITIRTELQGEYLSPIPGSLLSMQIARLLDNALSQGLGIAAISVEFCPDDLDEYISFNIYDTTDAFPEPSTYGQGLRGLVRDLNDYECGFRYKPIQDENYKKAAVIVVPVADVLPLPEEKKPHNRFIIGGLILIIVVLVLLSAIHRISGGTPIQFAGEGNSVVEFRIDVGSPVSIPLCEGGRTPRVRVNLLNTDCHPSHCTLNQALEALAPCEQSLLAPECPKTLQWTPTFVDGRRLGKNYELAVECFSPGPPESSDSQHIRLVVTRPNSKPELAFMQLIDNDSGEASAIKPGKLKSIPANAKVSLKVVALDKDSDLITYKLYPPVGQTLESYDGLFQIQLDWTQFGTWTGIVTITDGYSEEQKYTVQLKAGILRDIHLASADIWSASYPTAIPCFGSEGMMLCNATEDRVNEFSLKIQFDPLLQNIVGAISLSISEETPYYYIQNSFSHEKIGRKSIASAPGDRWEIRMAATHQQIALIELSNITRGSSPGLVIYDFNVAMSHFLPFDNNQLIVNVDVSELSRRSKPLRTMFIFSRQSSIEKSFAVNMRHIHLQEYEKELYAKRGQETVHIYHTNNNEKLKTLDVSPITCEDKRLEDYFEEPVLDSLSENAWSLNIGLKPGCILGLNALESEKNCALTISTPSKTDEVTIWITVRNASCSPFFEKFELISTKQELERGIVRWDWTLIDPDNDVTRDSFDISPNTSNLKLEIKESNELPSGIRQYSGTIHGKQTCKTSVKHEALLIRDHDNHVVRKSLQAPIHCPALVTIAQTQNEFVVNEFVIDEEEELVIPLTYDEKVKVDVEDGLGFIENRSYKWTGNCIYGKGPHNISIRAESEEWYGNPLQFAVRLARCKARFVVERDGNPVLPYNPVIVPIDSSVQLLFNVQKAPFSSFELNAEWSTPNEDMYLTKRDNSVQITCGMKKTNNILRIQLEPKKEFEDTYLPSKTVLFEVRCE